MLFTQLNDGILFRPITLQHGGKLGPAISLMFIHQPLFTMQWTYNCQELGNSFSEGNQKKHWKGK